MCGIFLCVSSHPKVASEVLSEVKSSLTNRGPNRECIETLIVENETDTCPKLYITFFGCVLWLRGKCPQKQPLKDKNGGLLLWNGDVFGGVDLGEKCDTLLVSEKLSDPSTNIPKFLSRIQGPHAFVYYQPATKSIWFGRDFFGRHSLLIHKAKDLLVLTSVISGNLITNYNFIEVPADGVYHSSIDVFENYSIDLYPYLREMSRNPKECNVIQIYDSISSNIGNALHNTYLNDTINDGFYEKFNLSDKDQENILLQLLADEEYYNLVQQFTNVLKEAVRKRVMCQPGFCKKCIDKILQQNREVNRRNVCDHPKISVLFSGGIDCAVIAALAHMCIPPGEELDLVNVAFGQESANEKKSSDIKTHNLSFAVPDRQTGLIALSELETVFPQRKFNFVMTNIEKDELVVKRNEDIKQLLYPLDTVLDDSIGCAIWFAARGRGILIMKDASELSEYYESPARVVLLGMGADEQLGGYSRHRERFRKEKYEGLLNEIRLGIKNRLSTDNNVLAFTSLVLRNYQFT